MEPELPKTMRACQWKSNAGGIENNLRFTKDAPLPKKAKALPKGYTLVKIAYTAVNPIDYKLAENPIASRVLSKPAIPCLDFAGTVVETKHAALQAGDAVFGKSDPPTFGCLAEYVVVGPKLINKVPEGVSLRDAVCVGVAALAAYQCIVPFTKAGDEVFINGGSGGTGTFGIQIAKALGCRVTTTCSAANVELVKSLGADIVIDYTQEDVLKHLRDGGRYYDLFVDNVFNNRQLYWQCHFYLEPAATFTTPGDAKLGAIKDIGLAYVLPGMLGGGQRKFVFVSADDGSATREKIGQWMKEGKVKAVIEQEYALEDAAEAFAKLKTGRAKGKLIVNVAGS